MIKNIYQLNELSGLSEERKSMILNEYEKIKNDNSTLLNWRIFQYGFTPFVIVFIVFILKPFGEPKLGWIFIPYLLITSLCGYGLEKIYANEKSGTEPSPSL